MRLWQFYRLDFLKCKKENSLRENLNTLRWVKKASSKELSEDFSDEYLQKTIIDYFDGKKFDIGNNAYLVGIIIGFDPKKPEIRLYKQKITDDSDFDYMNNLKKSLYYEDKGYFSFPDEDEVDIFIGYIKTMMSDVYKITIVVV